jgi:hypothetical protein
MFKVQHRSIDETAAIYGFTFVPSPGGEPLVAGWLEPIRRYRRPPSIGRLARRRGADFDAVVFDDYALIGSDGIGRVAFIRAMCLPDGLQRRGFGREVVRQLAMIWSDEWVLEIQADASTEAGSAAFKSWGFDGVNGHLFLPIGGHLFSPLMAMFSPQWWPRISPPTQVDDGGSQVSGRTPLPAVA